MFWELIDGGNIQPFDEVSARCIPMRKIVVLAVGLAVAYWLDQTYNGGQYTGALGNMLREIAAHFR